MKIANWLILGSTCAGAYALYYFREKGFAMIRLKPTSGMQFAI